MSYQFVDTNKPIPENSFLPSEAMNFNGQYIEHLISGYRTLSVSGREGLNTTINAFKISGSVGKWVSNTTLPERILTIEYQLKAKTPSELMGKWLQLNQILGVNDYGIPNENVEIFFYDDKEIVYYGMKSDMDEPPRGQLEVRSTFTIFCSDSIKYSKSKASEVLWGSNTIDFQAHYKLGNTGVGAFDKQITANTTIATYVEGRAVRPSIKLVGSGTNVVITCNGKKITVGTFNNATITIDVEMFISYVNGVEKIIDMDDFWLMPNKNISITGTGMNFKLTIDYQNAFI